MPYMVVYCRRKLVFIVILRLCSIYKLFIFLIVSPTSHRLKFLEICVSHCQGHICLVSHVCFYATQFETVREDRFIFLKTIFKVKL